MGGAGAKDSVISALKSFARSLLGGMIKPLNKLVVVLISGELMASVALMMSPLALIVIQAVDDVVLLVN